jgi:hypothetical protein
MIFGSFSVPLTRVNELVTSKDYRYNCKCSIKRVEGGGVAMVWYERSLFPLKKPALGPWSFLTGFGREAPLKPEFLHKSQAWTFPFLYCEPVTSNYDHSLQIFKQRITFTFNRFTRDITFLLHTEAELTHFCLEVGACEDAKTCNLKTHICNLCEERWKYAYFLRHCSH